MHGSSAVTGRIAAGAVRVLSWSIVLAAVFAATSDAAPVPDAPRWDHDVELGSEAGYAQLRWTPPTTRDGTDAAVHWIYQLQEGRSPQFENTDREYQGQQESSFVSGLENGRYFYRVRARHPESEAWGAWSTVAHVDVQHHSQGSALLLLAVGAVVFFATAGFLVVHRNAPVPDSVRAHAAPNAPQTEEVLR